MDHVILLLLKLPPHDGVTYNNNKTVNASNTYLQFLTSEQHIIRVSIASILDSGYPIDGETGDDLALVSDELVDCNGNPLNPTI